MDKVTSVKELIKNNRYLTLSTTDNKRPWVAPLYYVTDAKWNFYFVSPTEALHTKHILTNPNCAFAIFNSTQEPGTGVGLQASGTASKIAITECPNVVTEYIEILKKFKVNMAKYYVFKIVPTKLFVTDQEAWDKEGIDKRSEVTL